MYVFTCCKYTNNIYEVIAESVGPLEILGPRPKISCGLSHQINQEHNSNLRAVVTTLGLLSINYKRISSVFNPK